MTSTPCSAYSALNLATARFRAVLCNEVGVAHAGSDDKDLLGFALEDQGHVGVDEMNVAHDIDLEAFDEVLLKLLGPACTVSFVSLGRQRMTTAFFWGRH
jgi:hypothetical protein